MQTRRNVIAFPGKPNAADEVLTMLPTAQVLRDDKELYAHYGRYIKTQTRERLRSFLNVQANTLDGLILKLTVSWPERMYDAWEKDLRKAVYTGEVVFHPEAPAAVLQDLEVWTGRLVWP